MSGFCGLVSLKDDLRLLAVIAVALGSSAVLVWCGLAA